MILGIIPFALGAVGLIGFSILRLWEGRRGRRILEGRRAALDQALSTTYRSLITAEPSRAWRANLIRGMHASAHRLFLTAALALRALERPLLRLSHRMRVRATKSTSQEPSAFLKTIAPPKDGGESTSDTL